MNGPLFGIDVSNLVRGMGRVSSWEQTNKDSLTKLPSHEANLRIKMAILEIFLVLLVWANILTVVMQSGLREGIAPPWGQEGDHFSLTVYLKWDQLIIFWKEFIFDRMQFLACLYILIRFIFISLVLNNTWMIMIFSFIIHLIIKLK